MKQEKKVKIIEVIIVVIFLIFFAYIMRTTYDAGEYDYCVEWEGIGGGTLKRSNLLYTCYSLSSQTFFCDYEVLEDNRIIIRPILNITKNEEGFITEINYDEPNYFNCTRWLKSKNI